jgi:hypothetical protein
MSEQTFGLLAAVFSAALLGVLAGWWLRSRETRP